MVMGAAKEKASELIDQAVDQILTHTNTATPVPDYTDSLVVPTAAVDDGLTAEYPTDNLSGSSAYTVAGLNSAERVIFSAMKEYYTQVANGTWTNTEFEINTAGLGITVADKEFQGFNPRLVMRALKMDCAYEQYWHNSPKGWSYDCSYVEGTNTVSSITIKCEVHPEYALSTAEGDRYYLYMTDPDKIAPVVQVLQNARAVVEQYSDLSDYDKLAAYRDYICGQVEYNYDAYDAGQGKDKTSEKPWHLIYVFDNDPGTNVVCEGYAKAYKYLCDLSDFTNYIDCLLVNGYTSGDHMWNLLRINGRSYMVDLTGCDSEWGQFGDLFLAGAEDATGDGFTIQCPRHDVPSRNFYYYATTKSYTYKDETKQVYDGKLLTLAASDLDPAFLS